MISNSNQKQDPIIKIQQNHLSAMEMEESSTSAPNSSQLEEEQPVKEVPTINFIPDEVIVDILTRLPVKSLLRFRCVSKSWLSLISSQQFIKAHLDKSSKNDDYNHHKLLLSADNTFKNCSLSAALSAAITVTAEAGVINIDHRMRFDCGGLPSIVGSCHGLVCLKIPRKQLYLWNPATRKLKQLPKFCEGLVHLFSCYGFGYDESNDDYKIVAISLVKISAAMGKKIRVEVCSLKTDSWRKIEVNVEVNGIDECGKFVNGKLHWVWNRIPGFHDGWKILTFDVSSGTFGEVEKPAHRMASAEWTLQVLGGHLCSFCYRGGSCVDVWRLEKYGVKESWTKVLSIPNLQDPNGRISWKAIFISKEGEIVCKLGEVLALYNPKHSTHMCLRITNLGALSQVHVYVESLVSPDATDGVLVQCA